MAGKRPAEQWYSGDWFRAVDVRKCSWAVRGIWREMLDIMVNEQEAGKIVGTPDEICRVVGCTNGELDAFFVANSAHKFANVTFRNGKVTIICRRLHRAYLEREGIKKRVRKYRQKEKRESNADVTSYSSSSSSLNNINDVTKAFDTARKKYPGTKRKLDTEFKNFHKKHKDWQEVVALLAPAIEKQAAQWRSEGTLKKYIPHFQTWINQRRWEQADGQDEEERKQNEQKATEKKRQEIRDEYSSFYRSKTREELNDMRKTKSLINHWWLIDEVLQTRKRRAKSADE